MSVSGEIKRLKGTGSSQKSRVCSRDVTGDIGGLEGLQGRQGTLMGIEE